jgi:hypothetical protein
MDKSLQQLLQDVKLLRAKYRVARLTADGAVKSIEKICFLSQELVNFIDDLNHKQKSCCICEKKWNIYVPIDKHPHNKQCILKQLKDELLRENENEYNKE